MEPGKVKHRLVGMAVLAAIAALVVPVLIDLHEEALSVAPGAGIPHKPEQGFVTRVLPLDEWRQQAEQELEAAGPASASPTPAAAPASSPVAASSRPAAPASAWVVQVGSFASERKAMELRDRLMAQGYRAFVEPVKRNRGNVFRVRIGPELDRAKAEAVRGAVSEKLGSEAIVLRYP
ncbi:MAG TPA: SPOR domain-containing protein [Gammaproteobacteria bacterium]|nr:SPOR domain-containing protein [Gammaproteobacteria bacterium]